MKLPVLAITALTSLFTIVIAHSQSAQNTDDPFSDDFSGPISPPRMIRVHAEFIDMPHATYTALMAAPRTSSDDTNLRAKCTELISKNEARMVESLSITALPGQTATSESITEVIYPTESESPIIPNKMAAGDPPLTFPTPPIGSPPTPSAFDTKNVGSTLTLEAQIDNTSKLIDLRLTPTIVYFADQLTLATWKNDEVTVEATMPLFYVLTASTATILATGQPHMVSALSPQNEKGLTDTSRKVMLFLRADIITQSQTTDEPSNPQADLPRQIRVQSEFIEMPEPIYTKLMAPPRNTSNDTDLRAQCAKLIVAGEAHIRESMAVTALSGYNATTESISEFIYPTEYDPGEIPDEVNGAAPGPNTKWGTPPSPSAFDAKNLGTTFEVEGQIDDQTGTIDVRFTPTIVEHVDTINYGAEKHSGAAGPVEMPIFNVLTFRTGAVLVSGQPTIISTLSPPNEKGYPDPTRKIIVFLRADILTVGK